MVKKLIPIVVLSFLPLAAPAEAAILQNTQPADFESGEFIPDSTASLTRFSDAIETTFQTRELPSGAYTLWWILFDQPDLCIDGCGIDDLDNEAVGVSGFWASGALVGEDGIGNFEARLEVGQLPQEDDQILFGDGLKDPFATEVHTIARWHGPASEDPNLLEKQLTTFNGGCATSENPDGFPCADLQFAVFPAASEVEAVPEPSLIFSLLTLATVGTGSVLKRRLRRLT
ncbi:MAG: PEP-CTERM sorting domain-containing protein [Cyanobacteria bacterium P01_A01_bin.123]